MSQASPSERGMCQSNELQPDVKQAQAKRNILLNNPPGVYIISDRKESIAKFFQQRRIVVGTVMSQLLDKTLMMAQVVQRNCFVAYPSSNDDGRGEITTYGLIFKLAPVSPKVAQLWKERHQSNAISVQMFLERDSQDSELYHFVGWAESKQFSFSPELAKSNPLPASLNPKDLWYQGK
ncbi:hypothetical protein [Mastigocladopsis repens]|uniref:hypothetical protein n=1 Tax=Mastigocladopsis repens TaxID=221287 RepID=UPI001E29CDBE|nr:hypothetical protein [Mastigocladopsis repens]